LDDDGNVSLNMTRGTQPIHARMLEAFIEASQPVTLAGHEIGGAASAARKQVIVQQKDDRHLRVIVFASDNVNELGDGVLTTLQLDPEDDAPLTLDILTERPLFAPAGANDGLVLGDPVTM